MTHNFYIYGHGAANDQTGVYGLVSGSLNYGTNSTANDSYSWNSTVWEQGQQYVVVPGVTVSSNSPVTITSLVDPGGYSIISGMQIVPSASYCVTAPTGLVSLWQGEGNSWDVWGANSAGEYDYSFQSGQIGEAFFFDGYTTYLNVNASATLNVGTNGAGLTLACWLKPGDLNPHPVIEWNNGATNGTYFWMSNTLYANFKDTRGNNHIVCAPPNLTDHQYLSIRGVSGRRHARGDLPQWHQPGHHQPGQLHPADQL